MIPGLVAGLFCAALSYLCGSLNSAIALSKHFYGQDIREQGSGNPGFTNFKRVYGGRRAWLVLALDVIKSVVPCAASAWLFSRVLGMFHLGASLASFFVILGHCYPVWYGGKGGKGFLALAATVWLISLPAGLVGLAVFALLFFTLHYMSLAAVCASLTLPLSLLFFGYESPLMVVFGLASAVLIALRHNDNLVRLIQGKEPKFSLFRDKPPA